MKVIVDGEEEALLLVDPKTGVDWAAECIGVATDGDFEQDRYCNYVCSRATYRRWSAALNARQLVVNRIRELQIEHGADAVSDVVNSIYPHTQGLDDETQVLRAALDDAFGAE